jgi:hypothetical protein
VNGASVVLYQTRFKKKWRSLYYCAIIGANGPGDLLGRIARRKETYNSADF